MNLISIAYACCNRQWSALFQLMHTTDRQFYVDIFWSMAYLGMLFRVLIEYIKFIIYSMLQDIILPFSLPHLAISPKVGLKSGLGS